MIRLRRVTAVSEESAVLVRFRGALLGAGAAANTDIGFDDVLVFTLGDSLDGAVVSAGTALDASISDIVSHDFPSNMCCNAYVLCTYILAWIFKNAIPFFARAVYFLCRGAKIFG